MPRRQGNHARRLSAQEKPTPTATPSELTVSSPARGVVTVVSRKGIQATGMAVQHDGTINVVARTDRDYTGVLLRLNPSGSLARDGLAPITATPMRMSPWAVTIAPDDKVVVAGEITPPGATRRSWGSPSDFLVARLLSNGTPDARWWRWGAGPRDNVHGS